MAYQPSFGAWLLLWVTGLIIMNVLLVALAVAAAGQLLDTAATSAQRSAASLHNTASLSAVAYRSPVPAVTLTVKRWAAAARLWTGGP